MTKTNSMNVIITKDYDEMSLRAAQIMADAINETPNGCFGFATGSTPVGMYKALIDMHLAGKVDFSGLTTFNLDEYYPIQKDNDQSYDFFMRDNLFNHVNLDKSRMNIPNGETDDPVACCRAYEQAIEACGGIEMQLLGLGLNGHIGFNEPTAEGFSRATNLVDLTDSTIQANKRFFETEADVPKKAMTMGIKTIMHAKKVLMIVSGASKAEIVNTLINGPITPLVPASVLQLHHDVTIVLDKDAASAL